LKILFLSFLFLVGCGSMPTTNSDHSHTEKKSEIHVSARHIKGLSHSGYHAIEIDFQNTKDRWQKIKNIRIIDVSGMEKFHVVGENGIDAWKNSVGRGASAKLKTRLLGLTVDNLLFASSKAPISLPGKFKVERWTLIQKSGSIDDIEIEATYTDSIVAHYNLKII
jgi:uncharacterized protein YcfL